MPLNQPAVFQQLSDSYGSYEDRVNDIWSGWRFNRAVKGYEQAILKGDSKRVGKFGDRLFQDFLALSGLRQEAFVKSIAKEVRSRTGAERAAYVRVASDVLHMAANRVVAPAMVGTIVELTKMNDVAATLARQEHIVDRLVDATTENLDGPGRAAAVEALAALASNVPVEERSTFGRDWIAGPLDMGPTHPHFAAAFESVAEHALFYGATEAGTGAGRWAWAMVSGSVKASTKKIVQACEILRSEAEREQGGFADRTFTKTYIAPLQDRLHARMDSSNIRHFRPQVRLAAARTAFAVIEYGDEEQAAKTIDALASMAGEDSPTVRDAAAGLLNRLANFPEGPVAERAIEARDALHTAANTADLAHSAGATLA